MRAGDRADAVIGIVHIGDPVAQPFIHRILQRRSAGGHGHNLCPQQLHAKDVRLLTFHISGAHEHGARQVEQCTSRRGGNAMLPGAGFRDDARFAHALRQHDLPQHRIDLMRAGMVQLITLEIDFCTTELLRQAVCQPQRARPPHIMGQQAAPFIHEGRVALRFLIGFFNLKDQRHQRFGNETPTIRAEASTGVRPLAERIWQGLVQGSLSICVCFWLFSPEPARVKPGGCRAPIPAARPHQRKAEGCAGTGQRGRHSPD